MESATAADAPSCIAAFRDDGPAGYIYLEITASGHCVAVPTDTRSLYTTGSMQGTTLHLERLHGAQLPTSYPACTTACDGGHVSALYRAASVTDMSPADTGTAERAGLVTTGGLHGATVYCDVVASCVTTAAYTGTTPQTAAASLGGDATPVYTDIVTGVPPSATDAGTSIRALRHHVSTPELDVPRRSAAFAERADAGTAAKRTFGSRIYRAGIAGVLGLETQGVVVVILSDCRSRQIASQSDGRP